MIAKTFGMLNNKSKQLFKGICKNTNFLLGSIVERRNLHKGNQFSWEQIPVIINNRNRLTYLDLLVNWLLDAGMKNIIILDNDSTYHPLIEYYKSLEKVNIKYLHNNLGYKALWKSSVYRQIRKNFYIYTDSDVVPVQQCPKDVIDFMYQTLLNNSKIKRIGMGLKYDDLPEFYDGKEDVVLWESKFWNKPINSYLFEAGVDTTLAMYRPMIKHGQGYCVRTGYPYLLHHMPWYEDSNNLSEESRYYNEHVQHNSTWWSGKSNIIRTKVINRIREEDV